MPFLSIFWLVLKINKILTNIIYYIILKNPSFSTKIFIKAKKLFSKKPKGGKIKRSLSSPYTKLVLAKAGKGTFCAC
jgi:hypothetical protein